jgi:hypothetical protein
MAGGGPSQVAAAVSAAIQLEADRINQPVEVLATTLATLVVDVSGPEDPWTVHVVEWGDTRAIVFRPGSIVEGHPDWERLAAPNQDEIFANSVRPLPHFSLPRAQGIYQWMPGEMLLLCTDGIDIHLVSSNHVGHGLATAWESAPTIWQFIADVGFERAGARDDRTAVCLWRASAADRAENQEQLAGHAPASSAPLEALAAAPGEAAVRTGPPQDSGSSGSRSGAVVSSPDGGV